MKILNHTTTSFKQKINSRTKENTHVAVFLQIKVLN